MPGLGPMLARDVPFSGLYWFLFEKIKSALKDVAPAPSTTALISPDVRSWLLSQMLLLPLKPSSLNKTENRILNF